MDTFLRCACRAGAGLCRSALLHGHAGSGKVSTAVLASLALVLRGAVAVNTVPYLARRVAVPGCATRWTTTSPVKALVYSVFVLSNRTWRR